jgi:hypothetical protein
VGSEPGGNSMSNALLNLVWPLDLSSTEKLVLIALADAARDPDAPQKPGQCWLPMNGRNGKQGLVQRTCLTDRAIQKTIKTLVALGHITRKEEPGRGVTYCVHPRTTFAPNNLRPECGSSTPEPGSDESLEIQKEKKKEEVAERVNLPIWMPERLWSGYVDMRRKMDVPFTDLAAQETILKLDGFRKQGHDVGAILSTSIVRGYRDVFEPEARSSRFLVKRNAEGRTAGQGGARSASSNTSLSSNGGIEPPRRHFNGSRSIGHIIKSEFKDL